MVRTFLGTKERRQVLKVVGIYAIFSLLWIFLSDSALELFVKDAATIARISIFKGFFFVLVTAALLFHLIARYVLRTLEAKHLGRTSEERFRTIYDNMYDAVFINDAETSRFIDANQTACSMFGYSREELLSLAVSDISLDVSPYSGKEALEWLNRALAGTPQVFEWVCKRKDGSCFPSEVTLCKTTLDDKGTILAMVRDITEREFLQHEFLKVQKLESLGLLAGGIAHDFNNILTSILGNISFAQVFLDEAHKARNPLEQAEKAAHRAAELAGQLLTFAKGGDPVKKPVSVQRLVDESISLVLRGTKVVAAVDMTDDLHTIKADAGQINQAFNNIIINAVQAMPGGGRLTVKAENAKLSAMNTMQPAPGEYVKLSFSDEGCGIPDDEQKQIFDPYFTTKSGGTGLGLSSVYSIITRHGGHISVNSGACKGATFTIYLPSTGEVPAEPDTGHDTMATADPAGGSVLVMDDDEMILDLAENILHLLGYRVTTCASGEEAVSQYKTAQGSGMPFDVVIMDLTVPGGMGGRETAQKILAFDPGARLIVSSGYSNDPIMAHYEEYGFCGAMVKPYRITELMEALRGVAR